MKKYKEELLENENDIDIEPKKKNILDIIGDAIYLIIIIPLLVITLSIIYQSITEPDKIPDIFGYKLFMILDTYMDETLEYGDLVFTYNIEPNELEVGDIVAFRNAVNTVTIHKIKEINETEEKNRTFIMNALDNETYDTKKVEDKRIEGILVFKIPKIGLWILIFQRPLVTLLVIIIILIIGLIAYYIAGRLDERDIKKQLEEKEREAQEAQKAQEIQDANNEQKENN